MNKHGLTLIELMIYLALSMLILTLAGSLTFSLYSSAKRQARLNETVLMLTIALHSIARDLKQDCLLTHASKHTCIIRIGTKDLGWVVKNNRLMRCVGLYNSTTDKWSHSSTSQLAYVDDVRFAYQWQGTQLTGITCSVIKQGIALNLYTGMS